MEEPFTPTPTPKPCSTPHSAPSRWLKYDPGIETPSPLVGEVGGGRPASAGQENLLPPPMREDRMSGGHPQSCPPAQDCLVHPHEGEGSSFDLTPEEQRRRQIADFLDAYERSAPEGVRRDGWTPFLRKLFLQTIADTGRITLACAYTHMSRSAAYALAQRDRVFAAAWDAADQFARRALADHAKEQMLEGITETVTRPDGTTITRHRYDTRLTIAVLNRLDKRCDRAEERGSVHLAAMRNWDEYLRLIGKGDDAGAEALLDRPILSRLEKAQNRPACALPERANPIPIGDPPGCDPADNIWQVGTDADLRPDREHGLPEGTWMTTFPPPPGFDGYQNVPWDDDHWYERTCTAAEIELIEAHRIAAEAEERAKSTAFAEAQRDAYFAKLRSELASAQNAGHGGEAQRGEQGRGHAEAEEGPGRDHQPISPHHAGEQTSEELGDIPAAHRHRGEADRRQRFDEGQADGDHEQLAERQQKEVSEYPGRPDACAAGPARKRGKDHRQHGGGGDYAADRHPL